MDVHEVERLQREIDVLTERLSAARRQVVPEPVGEYEFKESDGTSVTLRELFGDKRDLLVIHNMGRSCPYCTMWADGFNGIVDHLNDRTAFVLSSPDEYGAMRVLAECRAWRMRMVSHARTTFARDMGFTVQAGRHNPGVSAYRLTDDGTIVRTGRADFGPMDAFCPAWHLFDLLQDGVGNWKPAINCSKCRDSQCMC